MLGESSKQCPLPRAGEHCGDAGKGGTAEGPGFLPGFPDVRQYDRFQTLLRGVGRVIPAGVEKLSSSSWDLKVSNL